MEAKDYITSDEGAKLQNVLHKELDLIQAVITRMAQNSFKMKGWCVTLVAAIFSLAEKSEITTVSIPLSVMVLFFWALDSNYLRLEKLYRALYDVVRKRRKAEDYAELYSLGPESVNVKVDGVLDIMCSWSEFLMYAPLILLLLSVSKFTYRFQSIMIFLGICLCGFMWAMFALMWRTDLRQAFQESLTSAQERLFKKNVIDEILNKGIVLVLITLTLIVLTILTDHTKLGIIILGGVGVECLVLFCFKILKDIIERLIHEDSFTGNARRCCETAERW